MSVLTQWQYDRADMLWQAGGRAHCLRIVSGFIRLDHPDQGESHAVLAKPGDLVGLEAVHGDRACISACAITDLRVRPVSIADQTALLALMEEAHRQYQRQLFDTAALHTGSVPKRLRRLLLLLSEASCTQPGETHALPRLKDMADLIGSAFETVSRILNGLERAQVLQARGPLQARFERSALQGFQLPSGLTSSEPSIRAALRA